MIDSNEIQNELYGLVSFRDHYDLAEVPALAATLTNTPRSGLYFQDGNANINLKYILDTIPENYSIDDYLERTVKNGISKVFTRVFTKKKMQGIVKTLVERSSIFSGPGNIRDTVLNEGKFVGFQVKMMPTDGLKTIIHKIGLQFTETQTDLPIYIYHSSQEQKVTSINLTTTKANSVNWLEFNKTIKYFDRSVDAGGSYYIGYYQDDISGLAIRKQFNFKDGPCNTCGNKKDVMETFQKRSDKMILRPIYVDTAYLNGVNLFDTDNVSIDYENNYGLNLDLSVQCDVTAVIKNNELIFAELIRAQVQLDLITDMKNSRRLNQTKDLTLKVLLREIEGDKETNNVGLARELDYMIKGASFDLSNLDQMCLPCERDSPSINSVSMWHPRT